MNLFKILRTCSRTSSPVAVRPSFACVAIRVAFYFRIDKDTLARAESPYALRSRLCDIGRDPEGRVRRPRSGSADKPPTAPPAASRLLTTGESTEAATGLSGREVASRKDAHSKS